MIGPRGRVLGLALALVGCTPTGDRDPSPQSFQRPPDWRLSVARTGTMPLGDGVAVAVQPDGLFLDNQRLVAVKDGWIERSAIESHYVARLADQLPKPTRLHANLYLHPDTRVGDLVDVLYTLGRNEYRSFQLAVVPSESLQLVDTGLSFSLPGFSRYPDRISNEKWLVVELDHEGIELGYRARSLVTTGKTLLPWDEQPMLALASIVEEFERETAGMDTVVFIAAPQLRVELLVEAMAAAGHGVERIIEAGAQES